MSGDSSSNIVMDDSSNDDDYGDESSPTSAGKSEENSIDEATLPFATTYEENNTIAEARLKALYPYCSPKNDPLPRVWSVSDRLPTLNVSHMGLRVSYVSISNNSKEASQIRTTLPINPLCGLYYFEIKVICGPNGRMGVGICEKDVSNNRLPGWDRYSYGYHGDDGHFFSHSANGSPYGPKYSTGDIIGCGINMVDKTIFFTKNGERLTDAIEAERITKPLYPTIGLQSDGSIIDANFGQKPFIYDIQREIKAVREQVQSHILSVALPLEKTQWMNKAIYSWLLAEGYSKTLTAFCKTTKTTSNVPVASINERNNIRQLIMSRRTNEAVHKIQELYPDMLETNSKVSLYLQCQQFVESALQFASEGILVSIGSSAPSSSQSVGMLSTASTSRVSRAQKRRQNDDPEQCCSSADTEAPPARRSPKDRSESLEISRNGSTSYKNGASKNGAAADKTATTIEPEETTDGVVMDEDAIAADMSRSGYNELQKQEYLKFDPAIQSGRKITKLLDQCYDNTGELKTLTDDCLSAVFEKDPNVLSEHQFFTDEHLSVISRIVNEAILVYEDLGSPSLLNKHFTSAHCMKTDLVNLRHPAAPFVDVEEMVMGSGDGESIYESGSPLEPSDAQTQEDVQMEQN